MLLLVCPAAVEERLVDSLRRHGAAGDVRVCHTQADLLSADPGDAFFAGGTLVCFNTGVIVPPGFLGRLRQLGYNFHAASPDFPGRDPHHWAIYRGATRFGVTAHILTEKVDAGPIVAVDEFDVPPNATPHALKALALERMFGLFDRLVPRLPCEPIGVAWHGPATTRRQLMALCDLRGVGEAEAARRRRAFDGFPFTT